ncbi:hypothetical protein ABW20_dc0103767 [Dactylellina cionopaga]|nr:hypothetical protein ABW20_dc0103767 [Dactylellina cionopaga]
MGLASKLASANNANPNYYGPPGGAAGGPPGGYPGQAPPGQYPPTGAPQGQYPPTGTPQGQYPPGQKAGGPTYQPQSYQAFAGGPAANAAGGKPGPASYGQTPMSPYGYNQASTHSPFSGPPAIPPRPGANMPSASPYGGGYQSPPPPAYGAYGMPSPTSNYPSTPYGQSNPYAPPAHSQYGQQHSPYDNPYGSPPQLYGQPPTPQMNYYGPQGQQPMGQQAMGKPPMGGAPPNPQMYMQTLNAAVMDNKIDRFYPPQKLNQIAGTITHQIDQLIGNWRIPKEIAVDFVKLALFDIVIYIDDSGSMAFEENGERIKDLKVILEKVAFAATLFDQDGISLRFMNNEFSQNNIRTPQQIEQVIAQVQFRGLTPMGTSLRTKVLEPLVLAPARAGQLQKPVLVIAITDGQPAGEPENTVQDAIISASRELVKTQYGPGAVSFQFAQVGNDLRARQFLSKLDVDPLVGNLIDCTSNYEVEAEEMLKASPPVDLTVELWLTKLLLGAIDPTYDQKDESGTQPQGMGGYGGPSQYGAAPQGQYGAPPGQYGAPPQGQYGAPQGQYGAPPQGQYGAPQGQYGAPPPNQYGAPQGQYGAPPPSQYGAPQGGQYGAPPPQSGQYGAPPGQYGGKPPKY